MNNTSHGYLKKVDSNNGKIFIFDNNLQLGFDIKRVYFITSVKANGVRGFHSHKNLIQILVCVKGSIKIALDDGQNIKNFVLDDPEKYILVGPMIWRTMEWLVDDSVLLVLASDDYNEEDYIRDYKLFLKEIDND